MTTFPELESGNVEYVLNTAADVLHTTRDRRACSLGEEQAQHIYYEELSRFCDDVYKESFKAHPGAGTVSQRVICVLLTICVMLFSSAVSNGFVAPACIALILSLICFCIFMYKFIFDGKRFDFVKTGKKSHNVLGIRRSKEKTEQRVVLVACADSPATLRFPFFGYKTSFVFSILSLTGNTLLFTSSVFFLFCGAPENSTVFSLLKALCILFIPVYILSLFIVSNKTASGLSTSVIPSSLIIGTMKQFHDNSFRFRKTEICCLITGCEHSSRAGAYAFAKKHQRLYTDVPTVFIPLEDITVSNKLAVFRKDGSGTRGSSSICSTIYEAADNLNIKIHKETVHFGSGSFTPFTKAGFSACSLGTSKKHVSKTLTITGDDLSSISKKAIKDVGALVIETLNYYDG